MSLSNVDLGDELQALSAQAADLAKRVRNDGDLDAHRLASGLVESRKIAEKLVKLGKQLHGRRRG
jgi:hypothetical protein